MAVDLRNNSFRANTKHFWCLFIVLFIVGKTTAEHQPSTLPNDTFGRYPSQAFNSFEMGLKNNTHCNTFAQSPSGRIYVTHNLGVSIYNGVKWKLIENPDSTLTNDIFVIDSEKILISTTNAIYIYNEITDIKKKLLVDDGINIHGLHKYFFKQNDPSPFIYFTSRDKILRIELEKGFITSIDEENIPENLKLTKKISNRYNPSINLQRYDQIPNGIKALKYNRIILKPFKNSKTQIGISSRNNLSIIDTSKAPHTIELASQFSIKWDSGVVREMVQIKENRIAVSTPKDGIYIVDKKGNIISRINTSNSQLPSDSCWQLFVDRQNGLWVSTSKGVARFQTDSPITYFDEHYTANHYIRDVFYDGQKLLFAISSGIIHLQKDEQNQVNETAYPYCTTSCWNILKIENQFFSLDYWKFNKLTWSNKQLEVKKITKGGKEMEYFPSKKRLLIIGEKLKLLKWNGTSFDPLIDQNNFEKMGIYKTDIYTNNNLLMTGADGNIYFFESSKMINNDSKTIIHPIKIEGIPRIKSNTVDFSGDEIIVASGNKLFQVNPQELSAKELHHPDLDHIPDDAEPLRLTHLNNSVYCLSTISKQGHKINVVNTKSIQQPSDIRFPYMMEGFQYVISERDLLNNLWCFGYDGAAKLDLSAPQWNQPQAALTIDEIQMGSQIVKKNPQDKDIYLNKWEYVNNSIKLSVNFPSYLPKYEPEKSNIFIFTLESKTQRQTTNHSGEFEADYLQPGHYHLNIIAIDALHRKSNPINVHFQILPPWYQSIWAIIGYITLTIIIFTLITLELLKRQKDKLWLERLEMKRQMDIETASKEAQIQALRLQINPHFLFNSLIFISNSLKNNPEAKNSIERLAKFLRHALEDKNSQLITLENEMDTIHQYLAIEHQKSNKSFDVTFNIEPETKDMLLPGLITQPIVENALKYSESDQSGTKSIHVYATIKDSKLKLGVRNSGQWKSKMDSQTPIGLKNVEQRLKLQYGDKAKLIWENNNETNEVIVELHVPLEK